MAGLVEQGAVRPPGGVLVAGGHSAPFVPGEHLELVERGEVHDQIAVDLPDASVPRSSARSVTADATWELRRRA